MDETTSPDIPSLPPEEPHPWGRRLIATAVALVFLAACIGIGVYWMMNRPRSERKRPEKTSVPVETVVLKKQDHTVVVETMGTVRAARSITLYPRVSGEAVWVSDALMPGGRFRRGDEMLRIEREDYALALAQRRAEVKRLESVWKQSRSVVTQRESDVVQAECALQTEMGQQAVARREYELMGRKLDGLDLELVLREPQLKIARANCDSARAAAAASVASSVAAKASYEAAQVAVKQAELDLKRTTVRAPFNLEVKNDRADVGSQVATNTAIADVVGTDEYWVELSVPQAMLRWIDVPQTPEATGSTVRISQKSAWGKDVHRTGHVLRLAPSVETQGRMARLLVAVSDPLGLTATEGAVPRLILGDYVRAEIIGRKITDVLEIPRTALHDGNRVWLYSKENTLEIRTVEVTWGRNESVFVKKNLRDGEKLIVSDLATPVSGMALRAAKGAPKAGEKR